MAKVLIPFSGGINSTFALHRWLTETDHDIVAVYGIESWVGTNDDSLRQSRETTAVNNMVEWLKTNCRDFTFEQKNDWPVAEEDIRPIRVGFTNTWNYGNLHARYRGYSAIIDQHTPDIFVPGLSLENTSVDAIPYFENYLTREGMQVVFGGSPTLDPVPLPIDWDTVSATLSGRFEQREKIPADLRALMAIRCDCDRPEDEKFLCLPCGWEKARAVKSDMTGAEFDAMFAEYGSYGSWRSEADPATYKYRGHPYKKFGEIIGMPDNIGFD